MPGLRVRIAHDAPPDDVTSDGWHTAVLLASNWVLPAGTGSVTGPEEVSKTYVVIEERTTFSP